MTTGSKTILLVDDSATVRRMLGWVLKNTGIGMLEADSGKSALQVLEARKVDMAIVDLNMPGMDGIELIRTIRGTSGHKDLPIIMLTTEGRDVDRKLAMEAGANSYLVKPSSPPLIRYKVLSMLGLPWVGEIPPGEDPL